jgi:DNA modification methylase
VDFICRSIEPIVHNLMPGGSICLNVSNDIFMPGSPARSLYLERMVLALHDRLGLHLMDRLVWRNPSKPPGPIAWASKQRFHLNVEWEPVYWFTNDPSKILSDNRRVLMPHREQHKRLMAAGGEKRQAVYADGAYRVKPGSFGNQTAGRIPRNVLDFSHNCADHKEYMRDADRLGLPRHGAPMPKSLAGFLINFLSRPGDLVADPFGGKLTTASAAEDLGRRWVTTEWILEYVRAAAERFRDCGGFEMPHISSVGMEAQP